jgi:peptide/nickel transport system permease protein
MTAIALPDSRSRSWRQVRGRFGRNLKVRLGLGLLAVFLVLPLVHPVMQATVWEDRPDVYHPEVGFDPLVDHPSGPTIDHLLGTDPLGRDVLSMLSVAITPSLIVAFSTALMVAICSMVVGGTSAYFGRRVDSVLTQLAGVLVLIPAPIMFLVIGKGRPDYGVFELGLVYGLFFGLGPAALVVRSRALSVMQKPFIEAARAAGGSSRYIITNHLAPHLLPHVATQVLVAVTGAMITEGFIELLGAAETRLGMGSLVYLALAYRTALQSTVPWSTLLTGALAISLLAAAFFLLSVGIQEAADPKRVQTRLARTTP